MKDFLKTFFQLFLALSQMFAPLVGKISAGVQNWFLRFRGNHLRKKITFWEFCFHLFGVLSEKVLAFFCKNLPVVGRNCSLHVWRNIWIKTKFCFFERFSIVFSIFRILRKKMGLSLEKFRQVLRFAFFFP